MMTIASYKLWKTWFQVGLGWFAIFLVPAVTAWLFFDGAFDTGARLGRGFYYIPFILLACISAFQVWPKLTHVTKQLAFDDGRAVWAQEDMLFVAGLNTFSIAFADVANVQAGVFGKGNFDAVVLSLKSGGEEKFPTDVLREPRELIVERIKKRLIP